MFKMQPGCAILKNKFILNIKLILICFQALPWISKLSMFASADLSKSTLLGVLIQGRVGWIMACRRGRSGPAQQSCWHHHEIETTRTPSISILERDPLIRFGGKLGGLRRTSHVDRHSWKLDQTDKSDNVYCSDWPRDTFRITPWWSYLLRRFEHLPRHLRCNTMDQPSSTFPSLARPCPLHHPSPTFQLTCRTSSDQRHSRQDSHRADRGQVYSLPSLPRRHGVPSVPGLLPVERHASLQTSPRSHLRVPPEEEEGVAADGRQLGKLSYNLDFAF